MKFLNLLMVLLIGAVQATAEAQFVIDDFELGTPFSLTTDPASGTQSFISLAGNVPEGARQVIMRSSGDPQQQGFVQHDITPGDDALVVTGFNPPNSGFIVGDLNYGSAISGRSSLNLDLSNKGDSFYIDLIEEVPGFLPWSGFYIIIYADGLQANFPDGIGTKNFLVLNGNGRHTIPFSNFGSSFNPADVDSLRLIFWSSESRVNTSPLRIHEIGVIGTVPEPNGILLFTVGLVVVIIARRC